MRWTNLLVSCAFSLCSLGCNSSYREAATRGSGDTTSPDDPIPAQPAHCDGLCVETAPATFTGPSLFWIGAPKLVPTCPQATPYQGIEGFVTEQKGALFARECRITPSDLCPEEGLTCAPLPPEEFHVCIHHDAESPCPADYPERSTLSEDKTPSTVTLCCQKSPIAS